MKNISPLRYPGGKSRAVEEILNVFPEDFYEFREPMVGGGSIFFTAKQLFRNKKFWINDLNEDLYIFWNYAKNNPSELISKIKKIKKTATNGKQLYYDLKGGQPKDPLYRALRFFVLNRITFSGLIDSGGYSKEAFKKRFTWSAIDRVQNSSLLLKNTKITNHSYEQLLHAPGRNVFIFLDPPYFENSKSKLYGNHGQLHLAFDHEKFAQEMKKCKHKWLITYDDSVHVRDLFSFANIKEWELQYGMNNYKQNKALKGKELFISNYKLPKIDQTLTKYLE